MEDFLRFLITPLLSEPQKLEVKSTSYSVTISVASGDMGRVIGKGGAVISAIRNLVRTYAISHQLPFTTVTLTEPPA